MLDVFLFFLLQEALERSVPGRGGICRRGGCCGGARVLQDLRREEVGRDVTFAQEGEGMLDGVLKFAYVSGPGIGHEGLGRVRRNGGNRRAFGRLQADEVAGERDDVVLALAQRRDVDRDHREAVVEVAAERALHHGLLEVRVGRGDHAHVHGDVLRAAHAADFAFLQDAQELALEQEGHGGDFVEEERAAVCDLEEALLVGIGAREGSLHVAEHLALEQVLGQGGAVDGHPRLVGARGVLVDGLRDHFLARAGLAVDQYGGGGGGDLLDHVAHLRHEGRRADEVLEAVLERRVDVHRERHGLVFLHLLLGARETGEDVVDLEGLREVVEHALLHRLNRRLHGGVGGEQDHGHGRMELVHLLEERHAVHRRHAQVGDHDVNATRTYDIERGVSIARGLDLVLVRFQQTLEQQENPRLVID